MLAVFIFNVIPLIIHFLNIALSQTRSTFDNLVQALKNNLKLSTIGFFLISIGLFYHFYVYCLPSEGEYKIFWRFVERVEITQMTYQNDSETMPD